MNKGSSEVRYVADLNRQHGTASIKRHGVDIIRTPTSTCNTIFLIHFFIHFIFISKIISVHSSLHGQIVVAVYNYQSREMSDVSFVKGDRMELIDDSEPDWWRVRHLRTGEEGLIPWNFVAEEKSVESEE